MPRERQMIFFVSTETKDLKTTARETFACRSVFGEKRALAFWRRVSMADAQRTAQRVESLTEGGFDGGWNDVVDDVRRGGLLRFLAEE